MKQRTKEEKAAKRAHREYVLGRPLEIETPKVYTLKRNQGLNPKGKRGKENDATHRQDRKVMLETNEERCAYCRKPGPVDLHHVLAKGSHPEASLRNNRDNHAPLCRLCHGWAGTHQIEYWEWYIRRFPARARNINLQAHLDLALSKREAMKR
jgi:hypothetical protein